MHLHLCTHPRLPLVPQTGVPFNGQTGVLPTCTGPTPHFNGGYGRPLQRGWGSGAASPCPAPHGPAAAPPVAPADAPARLRHASPRACRHNHVVLPACPDCGGARQGLHGQRGECRRRGGQRSAGVGGRRAGTRGPRGPHLKPGPTALPARAPSHCCRLLPLAKTTPGMCRQAGRGGLRGGCARLALQLGRPALVPTGLPARLTRTAAATSRGACRR